MNVTQRILETAFHSLLFNISPPRRVVFAKRSVEHIYQLKLSGATCVVENQHNQDISQYKTKY